MSFEDILKRGEQEIDELLHRRPRTSAAPAAAAVTMTTSTQEAPVSLFTEAKAIGHDLIDKLEQVDENAISAVEAIKVNPTGVSIVNTVASIAHLPDPQGLLSGADAFLKVIAAGLASAAATTQADPAQAVSGPSVAGQA